jgi:hypothetical protein
MIPGFFGRRGRRGKRGSMGEKGEKGADGQCEACCSSQFPLDEDAHYQEDERIFPPDLGDTEPSLEGAKEDKVKQNIKSKIRLF